MTEFAIFHTFLIVVFLFDNSLDFFVCLFLGFGYVSQQPWLVRGTIRDNILFGKPYDEAKFRSVVDACALTGTYPPTSVQACFTRLI